MSDIATCNDCIHRSVCVILSLPDAFENTKWDKEPCDHFKAADVGPRAEVESIFDELIKVSGEIAESYKKEADNMSCSDFARTEYRGTQIGALLVQYKIAELKKKYTERCPDCKHFVGCECFSGMTCDQYEEGSSNTMEEQPTDVVDVVRCKDCYYNKSGKCLMSEALDKENYDPNYSCGRGYRE